MKREELIKMWENAADRVNDAQLARLQRKSGLDLGIKKPVPEAEGTTPAGKAAQAERTRLQAKTIKDIENKKNKP